MATPTLFSQLANILYLSRIESARIVHDIQIRMSLWISLECPVLPPRLIVMDGLDECANPDVHDQYLLLRACGPCTSSNSISHSILHQNSAGGTCFWSRPCSSANTSTTLWSERRSRRRYGHSQFPWKEDCGHSESSSPETSTTSLARSASSEFSHRAIIWTFYLCFDGDVIYPAIDLSIDWRLSLVFDHHKKETNLCPIQCVIFGGVESVQFERVCLCLVHFFLYFQNRRADFRSTARNCAAIEKLKPGSSRSNSFSCHHLIGTNPDTSQIFVPLSSRFRSRRPFAILHRMAKTACSKFLYWDTKFTAVRTTFEDYKVFGVNESGISELWGTGLWMVCANWITYLEQSPRQVLVCIHGVHVSYVPLTNFLAESGCCGRNTDFRK